MVLPKCRPWTAATTLPAAIMEGGLEMNFTSGRERAGDTLSFKELQPQRDLRSPPNQTPPRLGQGVLLPGWQPRKARGREGTRSVGAAHTPHRLFVTTAPVWGSGAKALPTAPQAPPGGTSSEVGREIRSFTSSYPQEAKVMEGKETNTGTYSET